MTIATRDDVQQPVSIAEMRKADLENARRLLALPRLGDTRRHWRVARAPFGAGRSSDAASIEVYSVRGSPIAVLFHDDQAVAVRLPYAWFRLRRFVCPPQSAAKQPAGVAGPRILAADSGWMIATDHCDLPDLRLLAAL